MGRRFICIVSMVILVSVESIGQSTTLSENTEISISNATVKEAIEKLSELTTIEIFYSDDIIPDTNTISLQIEGTIEQILERILTGTGITFRLVKNRVVLIRNKKAVKKSELVINGYVEDAITGEELPGANIVVAGTSLGVATNKYGFYSLSLSPGKYDIVYSYIGYKPITRSIDLQTDFKNDIQLDHDALELNELVVEAQVEDDEINRVEMGSEKLEAATIQQMPALLGEPDIMRSLLILPGVQSVAEGKTGLYVRGSRADQTLIQLDEATVFNAFHIGGLFSVFNPDAIKNVELFKGGVPVQYGGRSSSVLDIRMKEGNENRVSASGGWGSIASRLTLEGPLTSSKNESKDNKGSFIISGRRTYLDLLLKLSDDPEVNNNTMFFYDLNAKVNYRINENNRIFASAYTGRDVFSFEDEIALRWGNLTTTVRWNHLFNKKTFVNTTFLYSNFSYGFRVDDFSGGFDWKSNLRNYAFKTDFYHYRNPRNEINFGHSLIWHHFSPAKINPVQDQPLFDPIRLTTENALEQGLYFSINKQFNDQFALRIGARISMFQNLGPGEYLKYKPGQPFTNTNVTDTLQFGDFDLINSEFGFEPRITARYFIDENKSIKASFNRNRQYLHVIGTNNIGFPTDRYKPSDIHLKPQSSNQWSLGYFHNLMAKFSFSTEVFYRTTSNLTELSNDFNAVINSNLEQELSVGKGWAYGLEIALKKDIGKNTGWISYTWSRAWNEIENLNGGRKFHPFYDRTHDLNISYNYHISRRVTLSTNWVYSSGQALSLPIGKYVIDGKTVPRFDDNNLNGDRGPAYHRLDFAIDIKGKNKKNRRWQGSWNIALYNVYFRKNSVGIQYRDVINGDPDVFESDRDVVVSSREFKPVSTYLFQFVPSITYNFKF